VDQANFDPLRYENFFSLLLFSPASARFSSTAISSKIPLVCVKDKISGPYKRARDVVNLKAFLILILADVKIKTWSF
jgi:hypothetical protein